MNLGIVPERFKMPHALNAVPDGLLIEDLSLAKMDFQPESVGDQLGKDLGLDLSHQLHMDLARILIPDNMKLRILLLQLSELDQSLMYVRSRGQLYVVGQDRFKQGEKSGPLAAKSLAGSCPCRSQDRGDLTLGRLLDRLIPVSAVEADLTDLLLSQQASYLQAPAGDLEKCQSFARLISCYLINSGSELCLILRLLHKSCQSRGKFMNPCHLKG